VIERSVFQHQNDEMTDVGHDFPSVGTDADSELIPNEAREHADSARPRQ
jgi:hypothetical protein